MADVVAPQSEKPEGEVEPPAAATVPASEDVNMTDVSGKENNATTEEVQPSTKAEPEVNKTEATTEKEKVPEANLETGTTANDVKPEAEEVKVVKAEDVTEGSGTALSGEVQKIIANELDQQQPTKKSRLDLQSLPTRQYLDQTVVPILLQGLAALSKERPPSPIEYLSAYLLKHKAKFEI